MVNQLHYLFLITAISCCFSGQAAGAVINLPVSGQVAVMDDPDNLLMSDLGLHVDIGDAVSALFTLDNSVSPHSTSPGSIYNFFDLSMNFSANFGAGESVDNINNAYRMSIWDDYNSPEYGDFDVWAAAVGSGVDVFGRSYLQILNIILLDTDLDMHSNDALYFVDDYAGWEYVGITIGTWYSDFSSENKVLLSTIPAVPISAPGSLLLMLAGVLRLCLYK
ncbi:hypothetical protein ACFL2V_07950 [Pseudomonadota bacterium]